MRKGGDTPLMRQYLDLKGRHPDAILFFQVGDFYEMFYEDAEEAARLLNLTLTSRNNGEAAEVPLAGVPVKAAREYVQRLIQLGRRVAICQQVEDASQAQGLVRREVVETVTPGAVLADELLVSSRNNFLAAVVGGAAGADFGLAWADISTGEFLCSVVPAAELASELDRLDAREVLLPRSWDGVAHEALQGRPLTYRDDWCFDAGIAAEQICRHFSLQSLASLGLAEEGDDPAARAAGGLLAYLLEIQPDGGGQLRPLRIQRAAGLLHLDEMTRRNLEVVRPLQPGGDGKCLLDIIDLTLTPMGARQLRGWLLQPLADPAAIARRLDATEELFEDRPRRRRLREVLRAVRDLERLVGRLGALRATPRDLLGLAGSLRQAPLVEEALAEPESEELRGLLEGFDAAADVADTVERAIDPEAPMNLGDGGVIRSGFSDELDELRATREGAVGWIAELQGRERERTGIGSLKVGYNRVFGYYIEVSKPNLAKVPEDYQRRQTLTNAERFLTPELKEWEAKVLNAEERIGELEQELFRQVREDVAGEVKRLQELSRRVALIDVYAALAAVAERNGYTRPQVDRNDRIEIRGGRHPVVECVMPREQFVPNDVRLDESQRVIVLTGPNMAGKSTILRQVGLICLLAQMGSFVPADSAEIGVADRIFTRVGASDNLAQGHSTFMVEMIETAAILNGATERSLVRLDEIGRGTSTYDGVSIAWSVTEYIHERIGAKTIFATHYHELTQIADLLPAVVAYNVAVKEVGDEIVFLRHLEAGGADRSYGVQVARLAGLPREVVERAAEILHDLEGFAVGVDAGVGRRGHLPDSANRSQLSLFELPEHPVLERLRSAVPDAMTPIEALNLLAELKREAGRS
ncbi:MAG: DNA mismatch repair protein MutS [Gemmatimonadota bacterium]|nr:MAG: DNA mismatch repair protein MutS [Gemmatimonadota bacterium]